MISLQEIYTIGFSKKTLRSFIKLLEASRVTNLIDIRLNNTSQLSGYAKKEDLEFVLELVGIEYKHDPSLAPDSELLEGYKKKKITWDQYEDRYYDILNNRDIKKRTNEILGIGTPVFLCSEDQPNYCHRRLLAEYLQKYSNHKIKIIHLKID